MIDRQTPLLFALTAATLILNPAAAFAATGERWETRMEMIGRDIPAGMPAQMREVCLPAQAAQTPGMDDKSCTMQESSRNGNRAYWKAKCKDGSTVSGDFTYQGDSSYRGIVNYKGGEGDMQMKISGKRLGGSCQLASAPAPANMGQSCDQAVASLNGSLFFGSRASCASRRKDFCARLNNMTTEEYVSVREQIQAGRDPKMQAAFKKSGMATMEDAVKGCDTTPAALEAKACGKAVSRKQYDFVGKYCPAESAELKRKHCEGRAYTALMASSDADLCDALGFDESEHDKPRGKKSAMDSVIPGKEEVSGRLLQEGVNQIKGMFSF